jgi:hypothetical protein
MSHNECLIVHEFLIRVGHVSNFSFKSFAQEEGVECV